MHRGYSGCQACLVLVPSVRRGWRSCHSGRSPGSETGPAFFHDDRNRTGIACTRFHAQRDGMGNHFPLTSSTLVSICLRCPAGVCGLLSQRSLQEHVGCTRRIPIHHPVARCQYGICSEESFGVAVGRTRQGVLHRWVSRVPVIGTG